MNCRAHHAVIRSSMELDKPEFDPSFALRLNVSEEPGKSELSSLHFSYFICKNKTNGRYQED